MATRFTVTGRVQWVGFRWATQVEAQRLGLRGLVRNLDDGSVQVDADGDQEALDELERWLHEGPPHARVTGVRGEPLDGLDVRGFGIDQ